MKINKRFISKPNVQETCKSKRSKPTIRQGQEGYKVKSELGTRQWLCIKDTHFKLKDYLL